MVSDLVFIELSTRDSSITRFLTGKRYQQGPLRHVKVLDRLMHLRNEATDRKIKETHGGGRARSTTLVWMGPRRKRLGVVFRASVQQSWKWTMRVPS